MNRGLIRTVLTLACAGPVPLAPDRGSYDALAVAGARLGVWRLGPAAWSLVQVISVPIQYGSSG